MYWFTALACQNMEYNNCITILLILASETLISVQGGLQYNTKWIINLYNTHTTQSDFSTNKTVKEYCEMFSHVRKKHSMLSICLFYITNLLQMQNRKKEQLNPNNISGTPHNYVKTNIWRFGLLSLVGWI